MPDTVPENSTRARARISVVIPAFNESEGIERTLSTVTKYLSDSPYAPEVIVVDDGSKDGTAEIVSRLAEQHPCVRLVKLGSNRGKGYAVRTGVLEATGDYILFSDADLSTPIEELEKLCDEVRNGYDVAIGSRGLPESNLETRQSWLREHAGRTFNLLVRLTVLPGIHDTQCGFKCFRRDAAAKILEQQTATGYEFDVELLCIARKLGYQIAEVPVTWRNRAESRVRFLRDSVRMFRGLLSLRRRYPKRRD